VTIARTVSARAYLLDMDGTLVNSDAVVERCWRSWAAAVGVDPEDALRLAHGRQGHDVMGLLLPERAVAENLADSERMLERERNDTDGVVPVPGARAFLDALAGHRIPYALVTSADVPLAVARMAAAGLPYPAVSVTAESVAAGKPDPEGFVRAAALLGASTVDCVVFEDSEAGITAGHAAGMRVVGVSKRAAAHGPDFLVPDLTAVRVEARADPGPSVLHLNPAVRSAEGARALPR
jgi:mannitol-1-/sugar-/sorbitol-6-phosphatase